MKIKSIIGITALLITQQLSAQFNQFRFYYGATPNTPAATITSSSITIPYKLEVTNLNLPAPMVASGGRIAAHVFLQGSSSDYYVGAFHHAYTYNTTTYGVSAPGYPSNPTFIPENTPAASYSPVYTTTQTASISLASACIPNGTYTVRIELYALMPSCETPDGAIVSFKVNTTTTSPTQLPMNASAYDIYYGKLGSGTLGTVTISGSSSAFAPTVSSSAGTCTSYGSLAVTATGGTGSYTLTHRKIISANSYSASTTVTSATSPITATGVSAGNYEVFLTDGNGCQWYDQVTVAAAPSPTITITPGAQTVSVGTCVGLNATVSPASTYTYSWTMSHATQSSTVVANTAYTCQTIPLPGGSGRYRPVNYQVAVSNAYCSGSATRVITADSWYMNTSGNGCCASSSRMGENSDSTAAVLYNVYPNPAGNQLTVTFDGLNRSNVNLEIVDLTGKVISTQTLTDGASKVDLDISGLSSGIYLVRLYSGDEQLMSQSFVRE